MLVYAPLGLVLLLLGRADLALVGELGMCWLASLPDYDQRVPFVKHRGVTHTLAFALLVGLVFGTLGWLLGGRPDALEAAPLAGFGFSVGTLAVLAHLAGDVITPAGITPLWPLSDRTMTLSVVRADNTLANYGLLSLGALATGAVLLLASPLSI